MYGSMFLIDKKRADGTWETAFAGTTIGNRRVARVDAETDAMRVRVTFSRADVRMKSIRLFEGEF